VNTWVAFFATTGVILSACYALYLYRALVFGPLDKPALKLLPDLSAREIAVLGPLVILTILFGFYPAPILDVTAVSVQNLVAQYEAAVAGAAKAATLP
jgi:NADH-quinone oxidoreductase subunit M